MKIKDLLSNGITKKIICLLLLVTTALLSIFIISKPATSPESYKSIIESIDEKKATVAGITATAASASTVLAVVPGDATTPIANEIMEISSYLLIVVCALVLEKSLLTVMGFVSFKILIPIACGLFGIYTLIKKDILKIWAIKVAVFALVIVIIIPLCITISDLIYDMNKTTIEEVTTEINESIPKVEDNEDKSWLEKTLDNIKAGVSNAPEIAKQVLNHFIDAIALFLITYCAIPVIIILLVIKIINFLFGIAIPTPKRTTFRLSKKRIKNKESVPVQIEV